MMFNQLGIRHLNEFRERVQDPDEPNPCEDFQFNSGGLDGMLFKLEINNVTQWPAIFRWSRVYADDRTRHICGEAFPQSAFPPVGDYNNWGPPAEVMIRNVGPEHGYEVISRTVFRPYIRCWNTESLSRITY